MLRVVEGVFSALWVLGESASIRTLVVLGVDGKSTGEACRRHDFLESYGQV